MRHFLPAALSVLGVIHVGSVVAQDTPTCLPTCTSQVQAKFAQLSCPSANDAACLCAAPNFTFGVQDCSKSTCGATDAQVQTYLTGAFCQGQPLPLASASAQTGPSSTSVDATHGAATTQTPATTTATSPPTTTPIQSSTIHPVTPTTSLSTSAISATAQQTALQASTALASSASSLALATASSSTSSEATSNPAATASSRPQPGLSHGTVIGVGVGVGAGVIAASVIAIFLVLRNRSRVSRASIDISKPPPSSGRGQGAFEKYSNDIEMVCNRYEDMVPRQMPKTMV